MHLLGPAGKVKLFNLLKSQTFALIFNIIKTLQAFASHWQVKDTNGKFSRKATENCNVEKSLPV